MKIAYTTYADCEFEHIEPDTYPYETKEVADDYEEEGWTVVTQEVFDAYLADEQAGYESAVTEHNRQKAAASAYLTSRRRRQAAWLDASSYLHFCYARLSLDAEDATAVLSDLVASARLMKYYEGDNELLTYLAALENATLDTAVPEGVSIRYEMILKLS